MGSDETYHGDDGTIGEFLLARHEVVAEPFWDDAPACPVEDAGSHDRDADQAVPKCQSDAKVRQGGRESDDGGKRTTYR